MNKSLLLGNSFPEKIKELRRIIPKAPLFLYKYMPVDESVSYIRDIICESRLYFSNRSKFNDPFDVSCQVSNNRSENVIERIVSQEDEHNRESVSNRLNNLSDYEILQSFNALADKCGILSLTSSPRNLLLWAHYSEKHTGICLQFYIPAHVEFFVPKLNKVEYSFHKPCFGIEHIIDTPDNIDYVCKLLGNKSIDWKYEKEWRLISSDNCNKSMEFNEFALTGIIYGAKCCPIKVKFVKDLLKERQRNGMPKIVEMKAFLSRKYYEMGIFLEDIGSIPEKWHGRSPTSDTSEGSCFLEKILSKYKKWLY